jgi:hypothetical protein
LSEARKDDGGRKGTHGTQNSNSAGPWTLYLGGRVITLRMSDSSTHPYTLEVAPAPKPARHFHFEIRQHGKLLQRSDRPYGGEHEARKRGLAEIEKLLHGVTDRR